MALFAFSDGKLNMNAFSRVNTNPMNSSDTGKARLSISDPNRRRNCTVPVTLKSLKNSKKDPEGAPKIFGMSFPATTTKFEIVAQILEKERNAASGYSLVLTDSTAMIGATIMIPSESDDLQGNSIYEILENKTKIRDYIRCIGTIRFNKSDGGVTFNGISITKVQDYNEIPHHMTRSVKVGLDFLAKQGKLGGMKSSPATTGVPVGTSSNTDNDVTMGDSSSNVTNNKPSLGDYFKQEFAKVETGYSKDVFMKMATAAGYSTDNINNMWDEKLENCDMYPTVDDETFQMCS